MSTYMKSITHKYRSVKKQPYYSTIDIYQKKKSSSNLSSNFSREKPLKQPKKGKGRRISHKFKIPTLHKTSTLVSYGPVSIHVDIENAEKLEINNNLTSIKSSKWIFRPRMGHGRRSK